MEAIDQAQFNFSPTVGLAVGVRKMGRLGRFAASGIGPDVNS